MDPTCHSHVKYLMKHLQPHPSVQNVESVLQSTQLLCPHTALAHACCSAAANLNEISPQQYAPRSAKRLRMPGQVAHAHRGAQPVADALSSYIHSSILASSCTCLCPVCTPHWTGCRCCRCASCHVPSRNVHAAKANYAGNARASPQVMRAACKCRTQAKCRRNCCSLTY